MERLSDMGIVHRDLKPENILIDHNGDAFLSDFGFSLYKDDPKLKTSVVGTTSFYPVEMVTKRIPYDEKIDVWSLGVTLFELLTDHLPF